MVFRGKLGFLSGWQAEGGLPPGPTLARELHLQLDVTREEGGVRMERDYYADLGVSKTASADEIGRAFRKLAARYHPDRNPGDKSAEENFKRIAEAYNVLSDPKSRAAYDRGGSRQVEADTGFHGFDT